MSAPTGSTPKSWMAHNRLHKEKKKKWREERLIRKVEKDDTAKVSAEADEKMEKENTWKPVISTVSIAVPGSILDNAQSMELRTYLAGQIARAACIYKIDEIIVFDDRSEVPEPEVKKLRKDNGLGAGRIACLQLARILQYLECPQYLRKFFFPLHKDLQYAGVLNPLDAPHHLRQQDVSLYREGVITNKPIKISKGSQVNVGLTNDIHIDKVLTAGLRVTVKIPLGQENSKKLMGQVVSPLTPTSDIGIYWGYSVRLAANLTQVFTESSYPDGYDITIGTSDKGTPIDDVNDGALKYEHALIVFGGLAGLEAALELDPQLNVEDPSFLFHKYLNTCPNQGSRTIRTEEAILVSLSELRHKLVPVHPPPAYHNNSTESLATSGDENTPYPNRIRDV